MVESLEEKINYLKNICTEQEIIKRLGISIYKYKKTFYEAEYEEKYNTMIDELFKYELKQKDYLEKVSIEKRMLDLLETLKNYYSVVKIGKYIGVSDTHLHRILDRKDKVKYNLEKLKALENLYYGTEIFKEEEITYYPHVYKPEYKMNNTKKYEGIEKNDDYVNYDSEYAIKDIVKKLRFLRLEMGMKGIEIARRLDISNTSFHFAYKGNIPKNPSKILNMINVEFKEEFKNYKGDII